MTKSKQLGNPSMSLKKPVPRSEPTGLKPKTIPFPSSSVGYITKFGQLRQFSNQNICPYRQNLHQQNVKQDHSTPGPTHSSMVPVVPLVHLDPPLSAISGMWLHKVDQAGSRWTRSGPGAPAGPWCWVVDQGRSGPPWSTKKNFLM